MLHSTSIRTPACSCWYCWVNTPHPVRCNSSWFSSSYLTSWFSEFPSKIKRTSAFGKSPEFSTFGKEKTLKSDDFKVFLYLSAHLMEISGIEPLTSWMPFAPWQVFHSANGGFTFKALNFCNLLHIVFWAYFNLLSKLLSKRTGQRRYSRTHQSFKYATPCFISKRERYAFVHLLNISQMSCADVAAILLFAAIWSRFFLFLYTYIIVLKLRTPFQA